MTAELPEGFPSLLGCRKHRPLSVRLLTWDTPLVDDHFGRLTAVSGLGWTIALDKDDDDNIRTIIDCTWAANALRGLGVDLSTTPLVAVQTWDSSVLLEKAPDCERCEHRLEQFDSVLIAHLSDGLEDGSEDHLPDFPRLKWTDDPAEIAAIVLTDLRARSIVGESMTVLSGTAGWDLVPKAPVYVQFRLGLEGELQIEARKDFAYWDTVVDDAREQIFSAAGFSLDGRYGYEMLLGPDPHDLIHREAMERAIRAGIEVFRPRRRRIDVRRIAGVSHIEGGMSPALYASGQRRIDRRGLPGLYEAADRRLGERTDELHLFEMLEVLHPNFGELIALAHLDEYFERMDDLHVLVPADHDVFMEQVRIDPLISPEDIVEFVLRHCFRWTDQFVPPVASDDLDADPNVLTIETVGHERFPARRSDDGLVEIAGLTVTAEESCPNGSISVLNGRLDPPPPPPPLIARFE